MCETEDSIRRLAAEGLSKKSVRDTLGISRKCFDNILEVISPVKFHSFKTHVVRGFRGTTKEVVAHFGLRISPKMARDRILSGMSVEDAFFKSPYEKEYEVKGVKGTLKELISHFGVDIDADRVRARVKKGWDIETALLKPVDKYLARNVKNKS